MKNSGDQNPAVPVQHWKQSKVAAKADGSRHVVGFVSGTWRPFRIIIVVGVLATSGCATRYRHAESGREGLVGFGRLKLTTRGDSVTSSIQVPGLCVGWADDCAGVALGWTVRERIYFPPEAPIEMPKVLFGFAWHGRDDSLWGIGWLRMRTPPSNPKPYALATAGAVAGFSLGFESWRPGVSLGLHSMQYTQVEANDMAFNIDQPITAWPGFDFHCAKTSFGIKQ